MKSKVFLNFKNIDEVLKSEKAKKILIDLKILDNKNFHFIKRKDKKIYQFLIIENVNEKHYIGYSSLKPDGRNTFILQGFYSTYIEYQNDKTTKNKKISLLLLFDFKKNNKKVANFIYYSLILLNSLNIVNFLNLNFLNLIEDKKLIKFKNAWEIQKFKENLKNKNKNNPTKLLSFDFWNEKKIEKTNCLYVKFDGANTGDAFFLMLLLSSFGKTIIKKINDINFSFPKKIKEFFIKNSNIIFDFELKNFDNKKTFERIRNQAKFIYNLINKYGYKKCFMCKCGIESLINASHIFSIKNIESLKKTKQNKIDYSVDANNGMWLCLNHHKLFDNNDLIINDNKTININKNIIKNNKEWIIKNTNKKIDFWDYKMIKFYKLQFKLN